MSLNTTYLKSIKYPFKAAQFRRATGVCTACGAIGATFTYFDVINDRLANEWGISKSLKKSYSQRESMHCSECRCSARLRAQAKALTLLISKESKSLKDAIDEGAFDKIKIAEINSCGDLHNILSKIENLHYSEYAPKDKMIKHEDLHKLSYKDSIFDYVLTSDTLEHVPDIKKALHEIQRILKPGGFHVFTVPLIFSRMTKLRVSTDANGKLGQVAEASYHGAGEPDNLVVSEFGIDFLDTLRGAGFTTSTYFGNPINKNEVNFVFVSRKER